MSTFTTVNNNQFDAALAAVSEVVGTIARSESVPSVSPNSHLDVLCTSAMGVTFPISYNDLIDSRRARSVILQHHSGSNVNADLQNILDSLEVISAAARSMSGPPYTDAERKSIMKALQVYAGEIAAIPNRVHTEIPNDDVLVVEGVVISSPSALTGRVVATIEGVVSFAAVRWSADSQFVPFTPSVSGATTINHTYTSAGTYSVTLVVFGPGGFFKKSSSVVVNGS